MSQKLNFLVFAFSVLIGVTLRTFMLAFTVEYKSGFIKSQYTFLVVFMTILMLIAAALVFFCSYYQKRKNLKLPVSSNVISGVAEAVMAVAILYEAFFSSILSYISGIQFTLHKVASLVSAAALIYMCVCRFTKNQFPKIITLIPVVFWIIRVITVFTEFATLATVTDTVFETVSMCLALVAFLNFSKQQCGIEVKSEKLNFAIYMLCGYFCALSSIPRFICYLISPNAFGYFSNIPAFTTFAAGIFVTVVALNKESLTN